MNIMTFSPKTFLAHLVEKNIIAQDAAQQYELDSLKKNVEIDQYLLQYTNIKPNLILKSKAELLNVPFVDIVNTAIDPQALSLISQTLAQKYTIMPYLFNQKTQTAYIASTDPLNITLLNFLETKTGMKVVMALAGEEDVLKTINVAYARNLSPEVKEAIEDIRPGRLIQTKDTSNDVSSAPIAKIVNTILDYAVKSRASDIHIEPEEIKTRVRYRIDGILQEKLTLPISIQPSLVSRIKILAGLKIDEKRVPQDGRFTFKSDEMEVDLRVSTLPTVFGEKIVMRLLRKSGGMPSLKELGLRDIQLSQFEEGIKKSYGIILITGPTGSGKTTTLYSVLSRLNTKAVNIITLEDPVEYQIEGINQVQVNQQAGLTFATGLKAFLRQDPNIILVGEIRDTETTRLAVQAALTGHLVFSTLHTNDAATAIPRLIDLGAEPFLIASVLTMSVAQRIVRKVCEHCKEFYEPPAEIQEDIKQLLGDLLPKKYKDGQPIRLTRGKKCDECNGSGYLGRIGIFEVLKVTQEINDLIIKEASSQEIEQMAIKQSMILIKQDGFLKALDGITTLEEVMRVTET
ncbi:Flp pilus assembly complex ATPase component TadA [Candidatus Woesebacteria bacterium]|nr:Flp pilus assembly complex ATPase component TadA [Candidatus Woesebacteria bacterium]